MSVRYLPGWLPGMGFKALAGQGRELGERVVNAPFEYVLDDIVRGFSRIPEQRHCDDVDFRKMARRARR